MTQDLAYRAPPRLAIAEGSSDSPAQQAGAAIWSTVSQCQLVWDGARWMRPLTPSSPLGFSEVVRGADGRVTRVVLWSDASRTRKIHETLVTRAGGWTAALVETQYGPTGVATQTLSTSVTRDADQRVQGVETVRT